MTVQDILDIINKLTGGQINENEIIRSARSALMVLGAAGIEAATNKLPDVNFAESWEKLVFVAVVGGILHGIDKAIRNFASA